MARTKISAICTSIHTFLHSVTAIARVQNYDELTEDYPDLPLAQVYPETGETSGPGGTERRAFAGGVKVNTYHVNVDIPCRQRSQIDEDTKALTAVIEAVEDALMVIQRKPYFGTDLGIQAFNWTWQRVNFSRGQAEITYPGVRFVIEVTTF